MSKRKYNKLAMTKKVYAVPSRTTMVDGQKKVYYDLYAMSK